MLFRPWFGAAGPVWICWPVRNKRAAPHLQDGGVIIPARSGRSGLFGSSAAEWPEETSEKQIFIINKYNFFLKKRQAYLAPWRVWEYLLTPCSSAPAVRSPFLIGFCSKFWTGRGTSSASTAASANVLCQKSVFHGKENCTVRMTSSGKLRVIYYLLILVHLSAFSLFI